jgi:acyl-coenzyme A synthetase/AMP-(fatty) acid ligase
MIADRIFDWAQRQPNATAVISDGVLLSYRSFSNTIRSVHKFIQQENLPAGRTAMVLVRDIFESWTISIALRLVGLNPICVHSLAAPRNLNIRDAACIVLTPIEARAHNLKTITNSGIKVLIIPPLRNFFGYEDALPPISTNPHLIGSQILYTSGTTGSYKKIMMKNEYEDQRNDARARLFSLNSSTIYHAVNFGLWTSIGFKSPSMTWHAGGCVIFDQRNDAFGRFFEHGVTLTWLIPGMLKSLLQARGQEAKRESGFTLSVAGGFLSLELAEQASRRLTEYLTVHFGSTEINSIPLQSRFRTKDDLLWLKPTRENLVQIVDESGNECLISQEGELRVLRSEIDCAGYLDDEEASAKVFRDGFFYPGDIAVKRADGRIRILGRTSDVVVLNAQKIAAAPIEQAIQRYLKVDEVCLFSGLTDQGHEEVVVAIQSQRGLQRSELETAAREFVPSDRVRFSIHKEFPRTETNMRKTQRMLLKRLLFKEIGNG